MVCSGASCYLRRPTIDPRPWGDANVAPIPEDNREMSTEVSFVALTISFVIAVALYVVGHQG